MDDAGFLRALTLNPADEAARLIYADWLDERGDPRGPFLRARHALKPLAPDHPHRPDREAELSRLRLGLDPEWLAVAEPERRHIYTSRQAGWDCDCIDMGFGDRQRPTPLLHDEPQDTECDAWKRLLDLVEEAGNDGREEFVPLHAIPLDQRREIVTLPPTIANLKSVKVLDLYGSTLVRIPPEISSMNSLVDFDPYTSYRLHWFPYEITRCRNLRDSRVSTRALYGNYKYRPPFPLLKPLDPGEAAVTRPCSVCDKPFEDRQRFRVWISLRVATDVLPLLVNACSAECVEALPAPPEGYVSGPHRGGNGVRQPSPR